MIKKLFLCIVSFCLLALSTHARKYPFTMDHAYEIQMVRVAPEGMKFMKVWGVAGSADKAIDRALQDAVAACIFTGVSSNKDVNGVPALTNGSTDYEKHKKFFDTFFKKGEFLRYVHNVNKSYPSGENNINTTKGRKVCLYVVVMYDRLRKRLEDEGVIRRLNDYF